MKAMFWIKVKLAAAVLVGAAAVGGGGTAVILAAAEPPAPKVEGPKAPAEVGKVAWGEATGGLQAGLVPLGGVALKDWPEPFLCVKCREFNRMLVTSKCGDCGAECNSNRKLQLCASCAAKKRVCQACGAAKPYGVTFAEGEPISCELHFRNSGQETPTYDTECQLTLKDEKGQTWRWSPPPRKGPPWPPPPERFKLAPGKSGCAIVTIGGPLGEFTMDAPKDAPAARPVKALPAGKYSAVGCWRARLDKDPKDIPVTTGPVEIEIKAAAVQSVPASGAEPRDPGSRPDRPAPADWQKLFADEGWYKGQAGEEQVFTGKLEGIPVVEGMATTLQRDSYYKLGGRTIYTGAKKVAALDALVGKKVEVRGKPVDMNLEGQNLKEIWPASVRAAP